MKPQCKYGHPTITPESRNNSGRCRECHKETMRKQREAAGTQPVRRSITRAYEGNSKYFDEARGISLALADAREARLEEARDRAYQRRLARGHTS